MSINIDGLSPLANTILHPALVALLAAVNFVAIPPVPSELPAPPAHASSSGVISSTVFISWESGFFLGSES